MPIGEHRYRCVGCGLTLTCGDCIPVQCPECRRKEDELRKAGWTSAGPLSLWAAPGVQLCSLAKAWQIYKAWPSLDGFSIWVWDCVDGERWVKLSGALEQMIAAMLLPSLRAASEISKITIRARNNTYRAVRGDAKPGAAP